MAEVRVAWVSVDPVRHALDVYPAPIAERLEAALTAKQDQCVLGADFFNATVHFHPSGSFYQTTPGQHFGRGGFKQPGYRSVRRVRVMDDAPITMGSRRVQGEWRICGAEDQPEHTFSQTISTAQTVVAGTPTTSVTALNLWSPDDLTGGALDAPVIVWQWCRGTIEEEQNVINLDDSFWWPYSPDSAAAIEAAFKASEPAVTVSCLSRVGGGEELTARELTITFKGSSSFALQHDETKTKERTVRRVIKTVQEVKMMFQRMTNPPPATPSPVMISSDAEIPHEFICPILQELMRDPVKTCDGFTYERIAIQRWLSTHNRSPLTNLPLASLELQPNSTLKAQIEAFRRQNPSFFAAA